MEPHFYCGMTYVL
jgi:tetratricopeptide (TPR) repeat protein